MTALAVDGLTKRHAGATSEALADVTFDVADGDALALVGPSGSGKTTVLRLIAGLDAPDSGRVTIGGQEMRDDPPERRGVGLMSQRPMLFPHLSVLDNVAFGPRMAGLSKSVAREVAGRFLDLVQLGGFGGRHPRALSGGQEQRVALARALASEPGILLLDEPFSALDPALREDMYELLTEIRAVIAPTIVLVTHDQREASRLCERIGVVLDGRLRQLDTADACFGHPADLDVSRFLGCRNEIPGVIDAGVHRSSAGSLELPAFGDSAPDGPATVVIRQELVSLTTTEDPTADLFGVVLSVARDGVRQVSRVRCGDVVLTVESDGTAVPTGSSVGLRLPYERRHAIFPPPDLRVPVVYGG